MVRSDPRSSAKLCELLEPRVLLASVPEGFVEQQIVSGLAYPTSMDIAPDGRVFIAEQGGAVRVVEDGVLLPAPFVTVPVADLFEQGLSGIELDPQFDFNGYVYVYYTAREPVVHNRLSRFTAVGNLAVPGSEVVLLEIEPSQSPIHNSGAIHFGSDGTLYVSVGDDAFGPNAQSLSSLKGKILRLNRDGSIPTDNPFYNETTGIYRSIWAMGLRNPFSFDIHPENGLIHINDVGNTAWEEINLGTPGANYGWPLVEGPSADPQFVPPLHAYSHDVGCAIVGAAFYAPAVAQFPAEYVDQYFFADFCAGWMRTLNPATGAVSPFATGLDFPTDIDLAADGSLYHLSRGESGSGKLTRISYTGDLSPVISVQPADFRAPVGAPARFTVVAGGNSPLMYQWRRDGKDIPGATAPSYDIDATTLDDHGSSFSVTVSNNSGTVQSRQALLEVINGSAPTAQIITPEPGTLYAGGQSFDFAGTGTDPEDGTLKVSALTWRVDFHHRDHLHPFLPPTSGIDSGSFTIPTIGETDHDVFYRIHLTVHDSDGLTHSTFRDLEPRTAQITLETNIDGVELRLDGQPVATPHTFTGVAGIQRTLQAPWPQWSGEELYQFVAWSDDGAATHVISTPPKDTTYTARFRVAPHVFVSDLEPALATNGLGPIELDMSNGGEAPGDGGPITLNGVVYSKGLGVHAYSEVHFELNGRYTRFISDVGVDDQITGNLWLLSFEVWGDDQLLYDSGLMSGTTATRSINLDVTGRQLLRLVVTDGGDGSHNDHADWAGALLIAAPAVVQDRFLFETAPHGIAFQFNTSVSSSLDTDDLVLENLTTGQTIPAEDLVLSYDSTTETATFSYSGAGPGATPGVLPDGNYRATLLGNGITDPVGAAMPVNYVFDFFFLNADASRDGIVNLEDFNILAANFGNSPRTFSQGDFNYDGVVNLADFNVLASLFGQVLAAPRGIERGSPFAQTPGDDAPDEADWLLT